jgi:hypothetical protein
MAEIVEKGPPPPTKGAIPSSGKAGLVSSLAGLGRMVVERLVNALSQLKEIASFLSLPSLIFGAVVAYWGWAKTHFRIVAGVLFLVAVAAYLVDISDRMGWLPTATVYPPFRPIYETRAAQLGKPLRNAERSGNVYQSAFDRAMIVWVQPLRTIFALPYNPETKVQVYLDADWSYDLKLFDEKYLKSVFKVPLGKLPPNGGVARAWLSQPSSWEWIGWRTWQCTMLDYVMYQEFENGKIMGAMRASPSTNDGQIYAVLNDGTWKTLGTIEAPAPCK